MTVRKKLRQLIEDKTLLVVPGAYDALSAKIIEQTGFGAVYMTGYGQAASYLGQPDVGLLTMTEMANRAACISAAVGIPTICDADTGFGNVLNVIRTVREYEKAGAAAIQLEDQTMPKRCGHMSGKTVVPMEEMVGKIKAAVRARTDPEFMIMARTDARMIYGIEEAVKRGKAYAEAGADIIFVESPTTIEEMKHITSSIKAPTLANMVEGGSTPLLSADELEKIGYSLAIFPISTACVAAQAVKDCLLTLKAKGTTKSMFEKDVIGWSQFNDIVGLPTVKAVESGDLSKLF